MMWRGSLCLFLIWMLSANAAALPLFPTRTAPSDHLSTCSALDIYGYVDNSYNYLLRSNRFISGYYDRLNDITENGFTYQQGSLVLSVTPAQGLGAYLYAVSGQDAYYIYPYGLNANTFDSGQFGYTTMQAYLQYAVSQYIFYAGELNSLTGIEQDDYGLDSNFSRSILNGYSQPGSMVGLRATDQLSDSFQLVAGLNNGWSTVKHAGNLTMGEFGIQYIIPDVVNLMIDGNIGFTQKIGTVIGNTRSNRYLLDIYGTWYLPRNTSVAMNYDYGLQNKALLPGFILNRADWQGLALYLNHHWTDKLASSIRGEMYYDTNGYTTGVRQNWREITLSLMYHFTKHFMMRAETRHDFSNVSAFLNKNAASAANNQQSYALEAYYSFSIH